MIPTTMSSGALWNGNGDDGRVVVVVVVGVVGVVVVAERRCRRVLCRSVCM